MSDDIKTSKTSKILKGMAIAYWTAAGLWRDEFTVNVDDTTRLKASLLWLADHINDEMVYALRESLDRSPPDAFSPSFGYEKAISAAIRAAAEAKE